MRHAESHRSHRIGWLRAAVLGANDGIVSTASLIVGVAAADTARSGILVAGLAGLVAGAMSMAAGEYVSVSSQADTEGADLARERHELATQPESEHAELARLGQVTRARISQIMDLLCLAPDIQEELLFLSRVKRERDAVSEHELRAVCAVSDWREQRRRWRELAGAARGPQN